MGWGYVLPQAGGCQVFWQAGKGKKRRQEGSGEATGTTSPGRVWCCQEGNESRHVTAGAAGVVSNASKGKVVWRFRRSQR